MTDRPGNRARWSAAALLAPVAAGLFTGTAAWSATHDPNKAAAATSTPATTAAAATPKPTVDPQLAALEQAIARSKAQVTALQGALTTLNAKIAAPASAGRSSAVSSGGAAVRSTSKSTSGSSTRSTAPAQKAPAQKAATPARTTTVAAAPAAPAPAPVTHTTTGASGAKP